MSSLVKIHELDNCAVAVNSLEKGAKLSLCSSVLKEDISLGHKVALSAIKKGENILKYGNPIGHALKDIAPGEVIHNQDIKTNLSSLLSYEYNPCSDNQKEGTISSSKGLNFPSTFQGYSRYDGTVGIRNDLFIIPLVGCINEVCRSVARDFQASHTLPTDSRVIVLEHAFGCSQLGDDLSKTRKILQSFVSHPNAAGVLIVGLGCENNFLSAFKEDLNYDPKRVRFFNAQDVDDEIQTAFDLLEELYTQSQQDKRTEAPFSKLKIGLKCGGSDALSGITANPLLGAFSTAHCQQEGTSVLTEVPEMFGAETLLMERAQSKDVFEDIVHLINDFKQYYIDHKQPVYENPSPGNKAGGISTLEEKSLGCIQKAGSTPVVDVVSYGGKVSQKGVNLLEGPGNDLIATTALAGAGCQLVLFTTGRGTPFGGVVPTMKISTNTPLAEKKKQWIDFDAGVLISQNAAMPEVCENFAQKIKKTCEGGLVKHEEKGIFGFSIFKTGIIL